jgi:hypothetical protein
MLERNLSTPNFSTIVAMYNEDLTLTLLAVLVLRSSVHRVAIVQTNQWGASGATVYTHVSSTAMYLVSVMFLVNVESVLVRGSTTDSSRMVAAVLSRNCAMIDERNTGLVEETLSIHFGLLLVFVRRRVVCRHPVLASTCLRDVTKVRR